MIKRSSQILGAWFLLSDLVVTALAWMGAYFIRFNSGWIPIYKTPPQAQLCWANLPFRLPITATGGRPI